MASHDSSKEISPRSPAPDTLQGPFNWQKRLKPTGIHRSKSSDLDKSFEESKNCDEEQHQEESRTQARMEDEKENSYGIINSDLSKIKEKLRIVANNKDSSKRRHLPVTPKIQSGIVPRYQKRKHLTQQSGESAFTRQIVKSGSFNRTSLPNVVRRNKYGPGIMPPQNTKIPQPTPSAPSQDKDRKSKLKKRNSTTSHPVDANLTVDTVRSRVEKVKRARLYLLQQMGPNTFLIGGDSPDHKYRVTIGPQQCSCGKGPYCLHVLFVMLRVFQVKETDPMLWTKLKNYEVEALFNGYHARRTLKLNEFRRRPKPKKEKSIEQVDVSSEQEAPNSQQSTPESSSSDEDSGKDEEDTCPICLLDMVEGESLVACRHGCLNKLHHHCIAVWFEECRRTNEQRTCPLCRVKWSADNEDADEVTCSHELAAPPNTRTPSPMPSQQDITLPRVDPIPPEQLDIAKPWIPILGEELVSCMFSKNWLDRETSLRQLTRTASRVLLLGVGEGRSGVVISSSTQDTTRTMLDCCFSVLAYMLADPVYKVFVAALKVLRNVLAVTPCRDTCQRTRLQALLTPVVHTVLWKCADSNKRTSLLSISALQELVKGQEGELAVGREIVNPGNFNIGEVEYLLTCILEEYDEETPYQWLLGRFYMLDNLIDEYSTEFIIHNSPEKPYDQPATSSENAANFQNCDENQGEEVHDSTCESQADTAQEHSISDTNHERVMTILRFAKCSLRHSHASVERMSRRIFYLTARLQVSSSAVYKQIVGLLDDVETSIQVSMRRRLLRMLDDFSGARNANPGTYAHGTAEHTEAASVCGPADSRHHVPGDSHYAPQAAPLFTTPVVSGDSTPRSMSPCPIDVDHNDLHLTVDIANDRLNFVVPPNSPRKFKPRFYRQKSLKSGESSLDSIPVVPYAEYSDATTFESSASEDYRSLGIDSNSSTPRKISYDFADGKFDQTDLTIVKRTPPKIQQKLFEGDANSTPTAFHRQHQDTIRRVRRRVSIEVADASTDTSISGVTQSIKNNTLTITGEHLGESSTDPDSTETQSENAKISIEGANVGDSSTDTVEIVAESAPEPVSVSEKCLQCPDAHSTKLTFAREPCYERRVSFEDSVQKQESAPLHSDSSSASSDHQQTADGEEKKNADKQGVTRSVSHSESVDSLHSYTLEHEEGLENETTDEEIDVPVRLLSVKKNASEVVSSGADNVEESMETPVFTPKRGHLQPSSSKPPLYVNQLTRTSGSSTLTDDYSDFLRSPSGSEADKVSFKTEVAQSPSLSPQHQASPNGTEEDCHCKEEVEREEAKALVKAIEQSGLEQGVLPFVPGLSSPSSHCVTIHCEPEQSDGLEDDSHQYAEGKAWVRGPVLGTGAFSTCYQARDIKTGTLMCVKQISFCRNSMDEQQKVCAGVQEEIEMMGRLSHPHIVRILGATRQTSHFFMFVEWMPGGSLSYLLDLYGAFVEAVNIDYTRQILLGLAYLHDNQILHRDLKGANLLVDSTGQRLRIGDFGAAARLASRHTLKGEFQGQLLGTIAFMAPETLRGESYGRSCDIWSVGCVLIEMLTCKPPWGATQLSNHLAMIFKIASTTEPPPIPENCHPAIRDLALRCLEINREERPPAKDLLKHPVFSMFPKKKR